MLILNLFRFYSSFASYGFKSGYNYFWASVCVHETFILVRSPESIKIWPFEIILSEKLSNYLFNYMVRTT
jgi:hypothetical protein